VEGQNKTKRNFSDGNLPLERFLDLMPPDYEARLPTHNRGNSVFEILSYVSYYLLIIFREVVCVLFQQGCAGHPVLHLHG
jgi:hypothetical protein